MKAAAPIERSPPRPGSRGPRPLLPRPQRRPRRFDRIVETTPLIVMVMITGLLASLVWFAAHSEREDATEALIRDALWVEQALRFQLDATRDGIERLGLDIGRNDPAEETILARFRAVVATHPEVVALRWLDPTGARRIVHPHADEAALDAAAPPLSRVHGFHPPRRIDGIGGVADLTVPVFQGERRLGTLAATIGLDRLLALHVPWWITQNNLVFLQDRLGSDLAAKSALAPARDAPRHALSFDPPLPGVLLTLVAHHGETNLTRNALVAAIFGLAAIALGSLFTLMRHYRRRLEAEESLGAAEAMHRAMEESLNVGMRARALDGRILYVNPAFCRMVGRPAEELIGAVPPMPYWLPDLVETTLARHQALATGLREPFSFETRFRRPDGSAFDVMVYEAPLIDVDGVHRGWMGSIIDVTDRKRAEERERLQAEKMTRTGRLISMGEMASTISHELNQPLAAISSYASGCLHLVRHGTDPAELVGALEKLDAQARRAGEVIRRVHDFVRKREPKFSPLDLRSVVAELAAFVGPDARKAGVEIVVEPIEVAALVVADRILLEQVLLNLVRNGIEAMAATPSSERVLTIALATRPASAEVAVTVADHGTGIDAALAEQLFSPFVSTKPEGMGMGLNICRTIIELHQGRLDHAHRPGGGTVFTVTLPIDPTEPGP